MMTVTCQLILMSDLQSDLRQLASRLTQVFARLARVSQSESVTPSELVPPKRAARPTVPPSDLELDLPLKVGRGAQPRSAMPKRKRSDPGLLGALRHPHSLREAFVLKEILDKPRATRRFRVR